MICDDEKLSTKKLSLLSFNIAIFFLIASFLSILVVNNCTLYEPPTEMDAVLETKDALEIIYADGDSSTNVRYDVKLSTATNNVTIAWEVSNNAFVSKSGKVTRPEFARGNQTVILTATLSKGIASTNKTFILTVIALPDPDIATVSNASNALMITYTPPDTSNSVTANVMLPAAINGARITWMSSAPNIAINGRVTRPVFGQPDVQVNLTATLFKGAVTNAKPFTLTVMALPDPDIAIVSNARDALMITYTSPDTSNSVTANVMLPTAINGVGITWMSSAPNIAINGRVTRPVFGQPDVQVNLTATLFKGAVTNTKPFILTVMALPDPDIAIVSNARDALMITYTPPDINSNSVTTNVMLPTVINGVRITWMSSTPNIATNGEVTRPSHTEGTTNVLLSASLFKGAVTNTKTFILTVIASSVTDEQFVSNAKDALMIGYSTGDSATNVTADVMLATNGANEVGIVWNSDKTDFITTNGIVTRPGAEEPNTNVLLTATLFKGAATNTKAFNLNVYSVVPDAEAVSNASNALMITYIPPDTSNSVTTNVLLTNLASNGVSIVWDSDKTDFITTNGEVTRPGAEEPNTNVLLTASLFKGAVTNTKVFPLIVYSVVPDAEAVRLASNALAIGYSGGDSATNVTTDVVLTNLATNGVSIAWGSDKTNFISTNGVVTRPTLAQGNQVVILTATLSKGTASAMKTFGLITLSTATDAEAVSLASDALAIGYSEGDSDTNVTTDVVLTNLATNGVSIVWDSDKTDFITTNGEVTRPSFAQGTTNVLLTATLFKGAATNTKRFMLTILSSATDAEAVSLASNALAIGYGEGDSATNVTTDVVLTNLASNGVSIVWDSDKTNFITTNGEVTRPYPYSGNDQCALNGDPLQRSCHQY